MNNKELKEIMVDTMRRLESNLIGCVQEISILLRLFHEEVYSRDGKAFIQNLMEEEDKKNE